MQNEINALRNQVQTLKRMLFGVIGLVVVGGLLAATHLETVPDVMRTKKLELLNDNGEVCAEISIDKFDVLSFRSGGIDSIFKVSSWDKKLYASINTHNDGCAFVLNNKNGKGVAAIGSDANGGVVGIKNNDGQAVAVITSKPDGGALAILDQDQKLVAALAANGHGAGLEILNKDQKPVVVVGSHSNGSGSMATLDSKGKVTSEAP